MNASDIQTQDIINGYSRMGQVKFVEDSLIRQTIQWTNCAPVRQLKHRKEHIEAKKMLAGGPHLGCCCNKITATLSGIGSGRLY